MDITDPILFPHAPKLWNVFMKRIVSKGHSEAEHHEEVDPKTILKIYVLLANANDTLESSGTPQYQEKLLKIPPYYLDKLNCIMQWGAMFVAMVFEVLIEPSSPEAVM